MYMLRVCAAWLVSSPGAEAVIQRKIWVVECRLAEREPPRWETTQLSALTKQIALKYAKQCRQLRPGARARVVLYRPTHPTTPHDTEEK